MAERDHGEDLSIWSAELWNDPELRAGQSISRAAPLCDHCWQQRRHGFRPVRVVPPDAEVCADCGTATRSGIYLRIPRDEQTWKAWER